MKIFRKGRVADKCDLPLDHYYLDAQDDLWGNYSLNTGPEDDVEGISAALDTLTEAGVNELNSLPPGVEREAAMLRVSEAIRSTILGNEIQNGKR